jgi:N,N-dimethylformamidase
LKIIGYSDRLSVPPSEALEFKVSTEFPQYSADLTQLTRGLPMLDPDRDRLIEASFAGSHLGRSQAIGIGSYITVDRWPALRLDDGLTVQLWVRPSLLPAHQDQALVSCPPTATDGGFWLGINPEGRVMFTVTDDEGRVWSVSSRALLLANRWYFLVAWIGVASGELGVEVVALSRGWIPGESTVTVNSSAPLSGRMARHLLIAASSLEEIGGRRTAPCGVLNGKLDRPRIWASLLTSADRAKLFAGSDPRGVGDNLQAAWDFARELNSDRIIDLSGHNHHGRAVNGPMRGVCGANWTGSDVSFHRRPEEYGAIAFHEDDLTDCGWETDFAFTVPADMASGVYAARLRADGEYCYLPFVVHPRVGAPTAPMLVLLPTYTYLAYANEKLAGGMEAVPGFLEKTMPHAAEPTAYDRFLLSRPDLGASVYDLHPDGTGICHSSRLRPIITLQPDHLCWFSGCVRHFSADLYLIEWLEQRGVPYDVATDEELHRYGADLVNAYRVVLTGSHPEYWTSSMMTAMETYLATGGRLMYLGGNGFYWVTGVFPAAPHMLEIRRGARGTRSWTSRPGEEYLSSTGEPGGLWRDRGRGPNQLVGVGFTAQGWGDAKGYRRLPASYAAEYAFIFDGVTESELIGASGLIMGGASGDEIDRHDPACGSPPEAVVLATSQGQHDDYYQLVIEDTAMMLPGHGGSTDPDVRADMTYMRSAGAGEVFSVGSMNWIGSLMVANGDNDVSRVTWNVLNRFMHSS